MEGPDGGRLAICVASAATSKGPIFLIGLGLTLIGSGEWQNRVTVQYPTPETFATPAGIVTQTVRQPRPLGLLFNALGAILFFAGTVALLLEVFRQQP